MKKRKITTRAQLWISFFPVLSPPTVQTCISTHQLVYLRFPLTAWPWAWTRRSGWEGWASPGGAGTSWWPGPPACWACTPGKWRTMRQEQVQFKSIKVLPRPAVRSFFLSPLSLIFCAHSLPLTKISSIFWRNEKRALKMSPGTRPLFLAVRSF